MRFYIALLISLSTTSYAGRATARLSANPVRKVINMLHSMQKKITAEGEQEKELYEKFVCYCKNGRAKLEKSIQAAEEKIPQEKTEIKGSTEQKSQLKAQVHEAEDTRTDDRKDVREATAVRGRHHDVYVHDKRDWKADVHAIELAVQALEGGRSESFVQTDDAAKLRDVVLNVNTATLDVSRDEIMAFLESQDASRSPSTDEIIGILKQVRHEILKNLGFATDEETGEIKDFNSLELAKTKEIRILDKRIENRLTRIGEVGVVIAQLKDDLIDTKATLVADKHLLAALDVACESKDKQWDERQKLRSEELVAIGDTIKVLSDDDNLELFKKTLPSLAQRSFLQVTENPKELRSQALAALGHPGRGVHLDLVALALNGKKLGIDQVTRMIDDMVRTLNREQDDDDAKKEYCTSELDKAEDQYKSLKHNIDDAETSIAKAKEIIATAKEEIASITDGIKALDEDVAQATVQRKKEHEEYRSLMADNNAAKELLSFAKDRLHKFYKKKASFITRTGGTSSSVTVLAQVAVQRIRRLESAIEPPPDTFGEYSKKTGESMGVIQMINMLIGDLDKDLVQAETEEEQGQKLYESMMTDSSEKREEDSQLLTVKEKAIADMEAELEGHTDDKSASMKELMSVDKYLISVHSECDWLLKYFDVRKTSRKSEIEAMQRAKAVLSGADFALLQTGTEHLRSA